MASFLMGHYAPAQGGRQLTALRNRSNQSVAMKGKKSTPTDSTPSEELDVQPGSRLPAKAHDGSMSGAKLKLARESRGITLKEVAERTKINVAILAALEEERFGDMPNARVYVRGFVRCLAREIGLDEESVSRGYVPRWEAWQQSRPAP